MKNNKKNISIIKILDCPSKYVKCFYLFQSGKLFVHRDPQYTDSQTKEYRRWAMSKYYLSGSQDSRNAIRNQIRKLLKDTTRGKIIKVPFCIRAKYFPINCGRKEYKLYIELKQT